MKITFSTVIRILAFIMTILFFVPNFIVSCDDNGETVAEISPFNIAAGNITAASEDMEESAAPFWRAET